MSASRRLASRHCSSVCQHRAISLPEAFCGLVWCYDSAWRRPASVSSFVPCGFPGSCSLSTASWVVVATLGIDLPVCCLVPSLILCTQNMDFFVRVSTLGVSLWVSCRMASRYWFGVKFGVATVGVATLSVSSIMSCLRASRGSSTIHVWNLLSASLQ
jgi:hypothetical protein